MLLTDFQTAETSTLGKYRIGRCVSQEAAVCEKVEKKAFARHNRKRILAFYLGLHGALTKRQLRYFLLQKKTKKQPPKKTTLEYWLGLKIRNPNEITVASGTTPLEFSVGKKTRYCISLRNGRCF